MGQTGSRATSRRESQDWELFADWCLSMELAPLPTSVETISEFLAAFPAPLETQGRRVRAIRRAHERAGEPLALPTAPVPSALREGAQWAPVTRALAQVQKYEHPKNFHAALRGRRDGWLIVLVGFLGLSRNQARGLCQSDVQLAPDITVRGALVPRDDTIRATECPACAVTRWLRIVGAASLGFRGEVQHLVNPEGVDGTAHDCATDPDDSWRQATTLLPSIDRYGWVSSVPMTARSVSATMARRQTLGPLDQIRTLPVRTEGRFATATLDEVADVYDDVDRQAAAILLRLQQILGDTTQMLDHLTDFNE